MKLHDYGWMLVGAFVGFFITTIVVQNFEFLGMILFVPIGIVAGLFASFVFEKIKAVFAKYALSIIAFAVAYAILYFLQFTIIGYFILS